jgi:hypothetical protein
MTIAEAQAENRAVFLGGSVGQLVSSAIWFASAALATWGSRTQAVLALVVGGTFIFRSRCSRCARSANADLTVNRCRSSPCRWRSRSRSRSRWSSRPGNKPVVRRFPDRGRALPAVRTASRPAVFAIGGLLGGRGMCCRASGRASSLGGWVGGILLALLGVTLWVIHRTSARHSP